MAYDYPTNITGVLSTFQYANSITENMFAASMVFVLFVVAFLAMKTQYQAKVCFAGASFLALIVSIFFITLNLIAPIVLIVACVLTIGSIIWLWFGDKVEY